MNRDLEHINIEFHNRASTLFFSFFDSFRTSIEKINRKEEEYLIQQVREKHIHSLQQQLQMMAKEIIRKHQDNKQVNRIDQNLNHFIKEYLHRFVQKAAEL